MKRHLTKDEINNLPLFRITCKIVVVETIEKCLEVCKYLSQFDKLGFDTESKPVFKKGEHSDVALIQLSTHDQVYLFRINKIGFEPSLIQLLENKEIVKAGVAVAGDLKQLKAISSFEEENFVELADLAKSLHFKSQGIRSLCASLFGYRISKGAKLSNWELDKLTPTQIKYAATDAWIGLQIFDKLNSLTKT